MDPVDLQADVVRAGQAPLGERAAPPRLKSGSHLWLSWPPGGPELPRANKIIEAFAVPG